MHPSTGVLKGKAHASETNKFLTSMGDREGGEDRGPGLDTTLQDSDIESNWDQVPASPVPYPRFASDGTVGTCTLGTCCDLAVMWCGGARVLRLLCGVWWCTLVSLCMHHCGLSVMCAMCGTPEV